MILGMMSLGAPTCGGQFPLWAECLASLRDLCDALVIRWDSHTGDPAVRDAVPAICGTKLAALILGRRGGTASTGGNRCSARPTSSPD